MPEIIETIEQKVERLEQLIVAYAEAFLHHTHTLPNTPVGHEPTVTEKPVIRPPAPVPSTPEPIKVEPASVTLEPTPVVIPPLPVLGTQETTVVLAGPAPEAPAEVKAPA